jgi:hypothetical protein
VITHTLNNLRYTFDPDDHTRFKLNIKNIKSNLHNKISDYFWGLFILKLRMKFYLK